MDRMSVACIVHCANELITEPFTASIRLASLLNVLNRLCHGAIKILFVFAFAFVLHFAVVASCGKSWILVSRQTEAAPVGLLMTHRQYR